MPGLTYNKLSVTVTQPRMRPGPGDRGDVTSSPSHLSSETQVQNKTRGQELWACLWGSDCIVSWYLMRSLGNWTLYWDELSVLSSISFVTYLTVWQVELITPDRIYPKWLKLPHLESQGGQRGGRKLRQNRKKIRFIMVNDVCNGRGHLFPNMETGKIWRKIGSIPHSHICDWVISSEKIQGDIWSVH